MAIFRAPEFGGLPYPVPPGVSYAEILAEAVSERNRAARMGEGTRFAHLSLSVANASRRLGLFDAVAEPFETALSIFRVGRDASGAAWAYWSRGNLCQQLGQHGDAEQAFRRSYRLACNAGEMIAARYALAGLAEITRIRGRYGEARAQHRYLRDVFRQADDCRGVVWAEEGLAQMDLRQNLLPESEARFSRALSGAIAIGDGRGRAWARRGLAEVAFRANEHGSAVLLAAQASNEFEQTGVTIGMGYAALTRARAYRKLGDAARSELCLQQASARFLTCRHDRGEFFVGLERSGQGDGAV